MRLALSLLVFLVWTGAQSLLCAEDSKYEGRPVTGIGFDPAQQPIKNDDLLALLPLKNGQPLHMADIRAAIDRLFATGYYSDIQVDAQPTSGGVAIRFVTSKSWFIGDVQAQGDISDPPNNGQLESATELDLGQPFTASKVDQALENQKRLLENNGLFRSRIQPVYEYDDRYQQIHIRFEIASGPRARLSLPQIAGDLKMDPGKIISATSWQRWILHTWKPMTQSRVRQGLDRIRKLYQKDNRLEARVSLESVNYDPEQQSAQPSLRIDAGPRIEVHTIGANISQKRIQRYVPIFEERAVDHDLLVEGAHNLRDYLQSQGYFEAEVEFKEQRVINDRASIDYLVNTGERHKLSRIEISGNRYFNTAAIRERMFLQPASFLQFPHGRYSEALLTRDEDAIVNLYQSNGFRDVTVTHRVEDEHHSNRGDIAVHIEIHEGAQYFVHSLTVDGIEHIDRDATVSTLSSTEGQPFSEFNVAVDRDTILAKYFANGYPNATFEWSSRPAAEPNQVDLHFTIAEGVQESVRDVLITGLKVTRPSLVASNVRIRAGDPLSPTAISETQRRLYDLGVFQRVDSAIQNPDGDIPNKYVLYEVDEARRYSLAVGVGAELARIGGCETCLDAPAGQTGFAPRVSFNITRNNMWGLAHSLSLQTRISTLERQGILNYSWPRFEDKDNLNLSFTGLYRDSRDVRTFNYKRQEGSIQLSQRISKATTVFYRATYRRVSVDQATLKIDPLLIPLLSQPVRLGLLSGTISQDRRDDPVDPHRGIYNTLDLGVAEHIFGSQRNFVRFLGRNATYHPLGKRYVLARSTEFGDIFAFNYQGDVLDAIPLPERFFGGGGTSNRGFPDFQAGPRDTTTGFPLGGTAVLFNQTELRFPLIGDNIGGVLFHDAGNVYSSLSNLSFRVSQRNRQDFDYMVHAVGFGLRYRTPIGPVRLDLAYSINPPRFFGYPASSEQDLINAGVNPCATPGKCVDQGVSHFQFSFSIGQTF